MKKIILILIGIFLLVQFTMAQKSWNRKTGTVRGNGEVQTEDRSISGFQGIAVQDGIDVYIHQTGEEKVKVEADQNVLAEIVTEVDNGILVIYSKKHIRDVQKLQVEIWADKLTSITASGGSDVYSRTLIRADQLKTGASGGSDLELDLEVGELECDTSGGSDARLKGKARRLIANSSGGSDLRADDLIVQFAKIRASGGSDAHVHVTEELELKASGGSDIHYKGNAKITSLNVSGASDVHH